MPAPASLSTSEEPVKEALPTNDKVDRGRVQSARSPQSHLSWELPPPQQFWGCERANEPCTAEKKAEAWSKMLDTVTIYSDDLIERWNKDTTVNLLCAGIFSIVLTIFNIYSYQLLSSRSPDPIQSALERISAQLHSVDPRVNSIQSITLQDVVDDPPSSRWPICLGALWLSSLILTLSAVSIDMMVKQWLNEFSYGLSGSSRQTARLRQHRLDNLVKWHVAEIVMLPPVLLQLAFILYLTGLLFLLWHLDTTVAVVASCLIGALSSFIVGTTILPTFCKSCCYLSPQSLLVFYMLQQIKMALWPVLRCIDRILGAFLGTFVTLPHAVRQVMERWRSTMQATADHCRLSWHARELSIIDASCDELDASTIATAYTATMDPALLHGADVCFSDLSPESVVACFRRVHEGIQSHRGGDYHNRVHWTDLALSVDLCSDVLVAMLCTTTHSGPQRTLGDTTLNALFLRFLSLSPALDDRRTNALLINLAYAFGYITSMPAETQPHWWTRYEAATVFVQLTHRLRRMIREGRPLSHRARKYLATAATAMIRMESQRGCTFSALYVRAAEVLVLLCVAHTGRTDPGGVESGDRLKIRSETTAEEEKTVRDIRKCTVGYCTRIVDVSRWRDGTGLKRRMDDFLNVLREHGDQAGLIVPELTQHLIHRVELFGESPKEHPWICDENMAWILSLEDKSRLDSMEATRVLDSIEFGRDSDKGR